jgi:membrane-bound lytic murein transglycosylase B
MRLQLRVGFKLTTAAAVALAPLGAAPVVSSVAETADHPAPQAVLAAATTTAVPVAGPTNTLAPFPAPQPIAPHTVIAGRILPGDNSTISLDTPNGKLVWKASTLLDHNLPAVALHAYQHAAAAEARLDPSCGLPWTLLAGIGRVESDHGRFGGAVLGSDGYSRPRILGVELNGTAGVAAIPDTDHGRWDGDTVWDRAVGPMQFIPSTWATAGRDGDGNGVADPNDINDAAFAAAGYLCAGGSVRTPAGMRSAIFSYNPSSYYVSLVMAFAQGYQSGTFVIPSPPAPQGGAAAQQPGQHAKGKHATSKAAAKKAAAAKAGKGTASKSTATTAKTATAAPTKAGSTAPKPTSTSGAPTPSSSGGSSQSPSPSPSPSSSPSASGSPSPSSSPSASSSPPASSSPSPSPTPPALTSIQGPLAHPTATTWTVNGQTVDFSAASQATLDKLGTLVGQDVTVQVDDKGVAQTLNGQPV